ncbi:MAG TPA: hypothetical protein VIX18_01070 [Nitrospirota bacterium]
MTQEEWDGLKFGDVLRWIGPEFPPAKIKETYVYLAPPDEGASFGAPWAMFLSMPVPNHYIVTQVGDVTRIYATPGCWEKVR